MIPAVCRRHGELLRAAWPSLSVENKLEIIEGVAPRVSGMPGALIDLALSDPAEIVRFWAARLYYFREPRLGPDGNEWAPIVGFKTSPEELQRTARAKEDPSPLVRAATSAQRGIGLFELIELPQLERLIKIRVLDHPATDSFASFVEKALAQGAPTDDVRDCMSEYLAREDVHKEVLELDADGASEFAKEEGWKRLWTLAASAPIGIAAAVVSQAPLQGKLWKIDLEMLNALPAEKKGRMARLRSGREVPRRNNCIAREVRESGGRRSAKVRGSTRRFWAVLWAGSCKVEVGRHA